jgi:hypothetical protein
VALVATRTNPHVTANTVLMFVMAFLNFATLGSVSLNAVGLAMHLPFLDQPHDSAEMAGQITAFVVVGVAGLVGVVWAPSNAYGLIKHKRWARRSTLLYWTFMGLFCCCLPGAGYGIWSLTRDEVKAALD